MYSVVVSSLDHAKDIAHLLSTHYQEINAHFSKNIYATDETKLHTYISHRLQENNSDFLYFSLIENGVFLGFINILMESHHAEILVVLTTHDAQNKEAIETMVTHAVHHLKGQGINDIRFETYEKEELLNSALTTLGAVKYTSKWFL